MWWVPFCDSLVTILLDVCTHTYTKAAVPSSLHRPHFIVRTLLEIPEEGSERVTDLPRKRANGKKDSFTSGSDSNPSFLSMLGGCEK